MTYDDALALIQAEIVANGNNEITADVLRPVLEAMIDFPNDSIGVLADLDTTDTTTIVNAINEIISQNLPNATALRAIDTTGIDFDQDELAWVADAVNQTAINNGAFTCQLGQMMVFFCDVLISSDGLEAVYQRRYYRLLSGAVLVSVVTESDLMPDGIEARTLDLSGDLVIDLGDIGTTDIEDAFNSDPNQPFNIIGDKFIKAVQNSVDKLWFWIGGDGNFGNSATLAVSTDFVDLTDGASPPVSAIYAFTDLIDTPGNYSGQANKTVTVKADETGLEFTTPAGSGDMTKAVYDPNLVEADVFDAANEVVDNASFEVLTADNTQSVFEEIDIALLKARGTEVYTLGTVAINADPTKFDIGAVVGQINRTDGYYSINYAGATAIPVTTIAATSTYVYLDTTGTLQQQTTAPTRTEWREKLFLVRLASNGTNLVAFELLRNPSGQYSNSIRDLYTYIDAAGVPLKLGLTITGNANLTFARSAGSVFEFGANSDFETPNTPSFSAVDPATFFLLKQDATVATGQTNIPVTQYDLAGTLTTMTANRFTAHRVYFFTSGNLVVQYGQNQYTTMANAEASISSATYVVNPTNQNGLFLGWWIVEKDATALNNLATSKFVPYSIGGQSGSALSGALLSINNLSDLQNAATARANLGVTEENIKGIALYNATTTGAVNIPCSTFSSWYRILTGNTTLTFTETPASGESFTKFMTIVSTATETLAFANADFIVGEYLNDTSENFITVELSNYPTIGLQITVYINQAT